MKHGRVKVVFRPAVTADLVKMSVGPQGCVLFLYVSTCFLCLSVDRIDPEHQPQLSSHDTREVAALSLAHTHSELFPVICTHGDKSPMWRDRKGG